MEPTPKKRRRWLIAAFVLVLVSLGTWWYWPRGDARFVGTWDVRLAADPNRSIGTIVFSSFGTGWRPIVGPSGSIHIWIPTWSVVDDEFVIESNRNGLAGTIRRLIGRPFAWLTGWEVNNQEIAYKVLQTSRDRLELRMKSDSRDFIFVRAAE